MNNLDYGIIGNCRTAALVSKKGSIDWCCLPSFDSSSVFAKILDKKKGGSFGVEVDNSYHITQRYGSKTNILITSYDNGNDKFEVHDFMPRYSTDTRESYAPPDIIRYIKLIVGTPKVKIVYDPKLEYGKYKYKTFVNHKYIKTHTTKGSYDSIYLYTNLDKEAVCSGNDITLEGDSFLLLTYNQKLFNQTVERSYLKLQRTKVYWLNWAERTKEFALYNKYILRSAMTLKLLSYEKTGAVLAALTTSLPETIGEVRNWDYRFCWIRDASMVVKVLANLGHYHLSRRYLNFITNIIPEKDEKIQIMYGINGEKKLTECILKHLEGYQGSAPVRVGNDAYKQKQHDIYGILMDVIYQEFRLFNISLDNSEELWTLIRGIVRTVKNNWKKPDKGIWEIRSEHRHFTFSKVLCWVAVDRAIKIIKLIGDEEYHEDWVKLRDQIKNDIIKNAWDEDLQAFTQSYGSKAMDASNLLMEEYGFIDAEDEKYVKTVKAIEKNLCVDGLMYRYRNADDFGKPSSSFTICTFWLINALYKTGEKEKAKSMFEKLLSYSNHLGLFSEDIDFKTKRLLGNFPQAYSHLALIETAALIADGNVSKEEKILSAIHNE